MYVQHIYYILIYLQIKAKSTCVWEAVGDKRSRFFVTGEHNTLRQKISEEKAEELQRETLFEQQRCEEERLLQEELVKQQQLAKGKPLT